MMHGPDLEVLKDIPGYKAILKAVLRSQIQLLVEQLADHTGDESVLLTANVTDGSLSHMGSESGKVFLQDHEEIKSQFLGFCLKRHHKRKAPDPQLPSESLGRGIVGEYPIQPEQRRSSLPSMMPGAPTLQKRPRMSESFSSQPMLPHPTALSRAGRLPRPAQSPASIRNQSPSHTQSFTEGMESGNSSQIKQEVSDNSDTQGSGSETGLTSEKTEQGSGEQDTNVKLEPMTESELDLEITGVEMGEGSLSGQMGFGQGDWAQNMPFAQAGDGSQGMEGFDPGSQGDMGNRTIVQTDQFGRKKFCCSRCGKKFSLKGDCNRHLRIHTGEKPYSCGTCGKSFSLKFNLKTHFLTHMNDPAWKLPPINTTTKTKRKR